MKHGVKDIGSQPSDLRPFSWTVRSEHSRKSLAFSNAISVSAAGEREQARVSHGERANGDETFASPAAAAEFEKTLTNGGLRGEVYPTKSYDPAEIDALRETRRDLEEKLAAIGNRLLATGWSDLCPRSWRM
ncbi:hypothetical protein ABZP36_028893 [Zizania latifolia]